MKSSLSYQLALAIVTTIFIVPAFGVVIDRATDEVVDDDAAQESTEGSSASVLDARSGVWQGGSVNFEFLPTHDRFGTNSLGFDAKLGAPSPIKGHFLLFSPSFNFRTIDTPPLRSIANDDLQLYSTGATVSYVIPKSGALMYNISTGLTWNGDGKANDSEALNISGVGLAVWNATPEWKWTFGLAYSSRGDMNFVPVTGAIWKPNDEWQVDLMFPKPKVARRLDFAPNTDTASYWSYIAGSIGGFSGVFEPIPRLTQSTFADAAKVEYLDFRLMAGLEKKTTQGIGFAAELGGVIGQKYKIESLNGPYWFEKYRPDPNVFLRTKATF